MLPRPTGLRPWASSHPGTMRYPLVIWDFDGTLADSLAASLALFNRLAPDFRLRPIADVDAARRTPSRQLMREHGLTLWRLRRFVKAFRAAAADEADRTRLFPGLADVLRDLSDRGVRLGVLSSNSEGNIRRCLRANDVEERFAFVVGYPRLFGKAKALRRILRAERADRRQVLYVGDEERDVTAAKRAGVAAAAVGWGFQTEELLRASGPDYFLSEPAELVDVVIGPLS